MDPIARTSLHSEVTDRLRSLIVESQIKPGERVPELEISKELGVSRTPIREALKVLASEGLVELLPLRGAVVKSFSPKDAADMLEVMGMLESFAAQKACKADQKRIDHVLAMHEKMKTLFVKGKRPEYFELNQSQSDWATILRGGLNYKLGQATHIRMSYGQGYRYPTIAERFIKTTVGTFGVFDNPDLKPETSWNLELGLYQGYKMGNLMGFVDGFNAYS
jgi:DNA-binding transcriptional regulator YhcF (GntR family)